MTHLGEFLLANIFGLNCRAMNVVAVEDVFHGRRYFHETRFFQTQHVHTTNQLVVNQRPHMELVNFYHA